MQCYHLVQSLLYNFSSFLGEKYIKQRKINEILFREHFFFLRSVNKMFRVGAKIRVGRETGNTGIFFLALL